MAITAAALQAELGTAWMRQPRVVQELPPFGGTKQHWAIAGGTSYPGRVKRISTTASDNAATQKTAVLLALTTGPTT